VDTLLTVVLEVCDGDAAAADALADAAKATASARALIAGRQALRTA
jgi:hypothetical protein